jgi:7,8-dihydroneopterin aldolase/epimerase/oxygenase
MDNILIRDLAIEAIVGLYPWERVVRQTLLIDMELGTNVSAAAASDDLQHTIDYSAVCSAVTQMVQQGQFTLIETLAESISSMLQQQFYVTWLKVAVYKVDVLTNVGRVGVEIERGVR